VISRKSPREIEAMRAAGRVVAAALRAVAERVAPQTTTSELDRVAEEVIRRAGGVPLFKNYRLGNRPPYPCATCISVNDEVVHGIPGSRRLVEGDIVSIDVGVRLGKYCADAAVTLPVGRVSEAAQRLIGACSRALEAGIAAARAGARLWEVSRAVQECAEASGCSVVREYTGHGIGRRMHEDPQVPNFVPPHPRDLVLLEGMTLAIEPMLTAGRPEVKELANQWTVVTVDGSLAAHFEHTIAVTANGGEVLTLL